VSDPASGRTASVFSDLTVPQFASEPLSLSSLNVELATTPGGTPAATLRRSFRQTDTVRAVLQIYQGTQLTQPIAPVAVRVQILEAKGTPVRDQTLPFGETTFASRRADCVITLPLAKLAPGSYLLKLDASLGQRSITRAMPFTVQ
jgi:hypothetical protein